MAAAGAGAREWNWRGLDSEAVLVCNAILHSMSTVECAAAFANADVVAIIDSEQLSWDEIISTSSPVRPHFKAMAGALRVYAESKLLGTVMDGNLAALALNCAAELEERAKSSVSAAAAAPSSPAPG